MSFFISQKHFYPDTSNGGGNAATPPTPPPAPEPKPSQTTILQEGKE
jgi:hypothetical protein